VPADASQTGRSRARARLAPEHWGWQLSPGAALALALLWQEYWRCHRAAITHPGTGNPAPGCPSPLSGSQHAGFGPAQGFPGSVPPHDYGGDKHQGALLPGDGRSPAPRARARCLIKLWGRQRGQHQAGFDPVTSPAASPELQRKQEVAGTRDLPVRAALCFGSEGEPCPALPYPTSPPLRAALCPSPAPQPAHPGPGGSTETQQTLGDTSLEGAGPRIAESHDSPDPAVTPQPQQRWDLGDFSFAPTPALRIKCSGFPVPCHEGGCSLL